MLALGQSRPEKQNTITSYVLHLLSEFTRACAGAPVVDVRSPAENGDQARTIHHRVSADEGELDNELWTQETGVSSHCERVIK